MSEREDTLTIPAASGGREIEQGGINVDEAAEAKRIDDAIAQGAQGPSRREVALGAAAAVALATALKAKDANAAGDPNASLAATPPAGFTPFSQPGRIVKVSHKDPMQENQKYPKADAAKAMLTKAMTELTGKATLAEAIAQFVHKDDIVCVKVNGIAGKDMGTNKELVLPFLEAMIESGVPAEHITVLEQYFGFLAGTRVEAANVPKGVKIVVHQNAKDNTAMAPMAERKIPGYANTRFVKPFMDATAVINFALIKDHSICGFTGALKNITHGCSVNPHEYHGHNASPQIALLYSQDMVRSRVRLSILDGFKVMAHGGPKFNSPQHVKLHNAVYVSSDPVALDALGNDIVEKARAEYGLKPLAQDVNGNNPKGRSPTYIQAAQELGLGIADLAKIKVKDIAIG